MSPRKSRWLKGIVVGLAVLGFFVAALFALMYFSFPRDEGVSPIRSDFSIIIVGFTYYYKLYQEYPQGPNREITPALLGTENKGRMPVVYWPKERLSKDGELLDLWGTPYYIKASGDRIDIRSAGPDKVLWNDDDKTNEDK